MRASVVMKGAQWSETKPRTWTAVLNSQRQTSATATAVQVLWLTPKTRSRD